ncbi:MAG: hypothetical protein J0M07_31440 [Anaerolineae bacterium]|uniref:hypothetical protein n=1 Tax=Candidatus Flexifilum breve TaxID=3140694 RepID=UPI001AD18093|nr:hypothetical protein [Chloroflexota bacterium]MBK9749104.1 hypothetical protein [Chloroflexota bacterium]MBN8639869.1 hypothetical protein [Anaerolineae bacterium]
MDQHYQEWSENAPRGLLLIGAGISVIGQAIVLKSRRKSTVVWFLFGLVGLILFNAGVSVFGEAVKHRTLYESKLGL